MSTIIALAVLGIITLFLGVMKKKSWLLPGILVGLAVALGLTLTGWNTDISFYHRMLVMDNYALAFNAVLIFSTFLIFLFAHHYYQPVERPLEDVYTVTLFALLGAVLMDSYGNLIMLFLGVETLSIALYILAGSHREAISSNEATLKYFLLGSFISGFLLFGIALIYGAAHSFDLQDIAHFVSALNGEWPPIFLAGLFLIIIGLAFKIAIVPFHFWAPDVYEGTPTLLTAFMASVVKTASIAALYRLFSTCLHGAQGIWESSLWILAALTILLGNLTGLYQPSAKRMLAYSSIAQSGYMILAVLAFSSRSANLLLFYTLSYSIATITAFGIVLLVREVRGNDLFTAFNGLGKNNPVEAFCMTVAMLSLTGIPPLAGFVAKFYLFSTAIGAGYLWLVLIAIVGSAVSVGYYFKPVIAMYLREGDGMKLKTPKSYKAFLLFATIVTILLGVLPFMVLKQ
ncbi:MAG: NADH-quinone oxidoreductase subunit N [Bacteroidetes bacterium]|nr:MAG: NADH-quinone oxidoreductase subunit N [Bacteroidota bacterium]